MLCSRLDPDPDVPVTVTVVVTGVVVLVVVVLVDEPPPQPVTRLSPITLTASKSISCMLRRFLKPSKQQNATASVDVGISGLGLRRNSAVVAAVVTVSFVEAAVPEGVTEAGAKMHVAPVGSPEQVSVTKELNPFCGVTETVVVPLWPPVTVSAAGVTPTVKAGANTLKGSLMTFVEPNSGDATVKV